MKTTKRIASLTKSIELQKRVLANLEKCYVNCTTSHELCEDLIRRLEWLLKTAEENARMQVA